MWLASGPRTSPFSAMLKYKADRRTLLFVGLYFASFAGLWFYSPGASPLGVAWVVITCVLSWITAVITHNTIHCPIFVKRGWNKVFQVTLTLAYGHPVSAYVPGHNLSHHKYVQAERDVMRTTKIRFRWNLLNLLFFLPAVALSILKNDRAFIKQMKNRRKRWYRQLQTETVIFAAVSIALLVLDWRKFLAYWYLPHLWAAWGIISINFLQHDGCDETHPYNHSRNFTGRAFGWFTFNNGFHGIHHIHPNLHWSLLREAHEEQVVPFIDPRLDEPSIFAYAFRAFIWPAKRLTFDGKEVVLPEKTGDVSWVPTQGLPQDVSLGAET